MKHFTLNKSAPLREPSIYGKIVIVKVQATGIFTRNLLLTMQVVALTLILLFSSSIAQAATKTWVGGTGTGKDWTDPANWSGGTLPVATDDILFNVGNINFSTLPINAAYQSINVTSGIVYLNNSDITTLTIGGNISGNFGGGAGTDIYVVAGRGLFLESNVTITLAANSTALIYGQLLIKSGCTYNTDAPGAVTTVIGELNSTYKGFLINYGTVTCSTPGNLLFNSYSTYQQLMKGGTLPKATWHLTSTCHVQISGLNQYEQPFPEYSSFDQSFGNLIWEVNQYFCEVTLAPYLKTVRGNLEIRRTGSSEIGHNNNLILTSSGTGTLTIGGTFKVGGLVIIDGGDVIAGNTTISRNRIFEGSFLTIESGTLTVPALTVGPYIVFPTPLPPAFPETDNFARYPNLSLTGGTVNINGDLYIYPTSYYNCNYAVTTNIKGNVTNNGSFSNTSGTVILNGSAPQGISSTNTTPTTFYNLTIDNSDGVTLYNNVSIRNTLNFISGILTTGTNNALILENTTTATITNAGDGKYVNGNLQIKVLANTLSKTFPIGDANN